MPANWPRTYNIEQSTIILPDTDSIPDLGGMNKSFVGTSDDGQTFENITSVLIDGRHNNINVHIRYYTRIYYEYMLLNSELPTSGQVHWEGVPWVVAPNPLIPPGEHTYGMSTNLTSYNGKQVRLVVSTPQGPQTVTAECIISGNNLDTPWNSYPEYVDAQFVFYANTTYGASLTLYVVFAVMD